MRLTSAIFRAANRLLEPLDLRLARGNSDFDFRPHGHALDRMCHDLASCFETWSIEQSVWPLTPVDNLPTAVRLFYDTYLESGFRRNPGGSRFNNLLWLFLLARSLRPTAIVDSGTFTGASAWALALGAPSAKVLSFDLDMSNLLERMPNVDYRVQDWSTADWGGQDLSRALCYFDDHVDQVRRAAEAHALGIRFLIFDDDFPCTSFAPMAHGGSALPKISFLLERSLQGVDQLEWSHGGSRRTWKLDHARLSNARALIEAHDRLPNTSLVTGIHQTPYRLVRLAARAP
jgi:hypothetical protein